MVWFTIKYRVRIIFKDKTKVKIITSEELGGNLNLRTNINAQHKTTEQKPLKKIKDLLS